jgi:hypothetical protein
MTTYRIRLRDCSTVEIDASEVTTRHDGSLWALAASDAPERGRWAALPKLTPVLILARGQWVAVTPTGAMDPFAPPAPQTSTESGLLVQCEDIPDPIGRRAIVAAKLSALGEPEQ